MRFYSNNSGTKHLLGSGRRDVRILHATQQYVGLQSIFHDESLDKIPMLPTPREVKDNSMHQNMERALHHLRSAATFQVSFEIEEPQMIKELLSKNKLDPAEIDKFVVIAFDETKEIVNAHIKQNDPYCGI